jgi:hypothetical protein
VRPQIPAAILASLGFLAASSAPGDVPQNAPKNPPSQPSAPFELPTFERGYWEYQRTVTVEGTRTPQRATVKRCGDPTSDIRKKVELGRAAALGRLT